MVCISHQMVLFQTLYTGQSLTTSLTWCYMANRQCETTQKWKVRLGAWSKILMYIGVIRVRNEYVNYTHQWTRVNYLMQCVRLLFIPGHLNDMIFLSWRFLLSARLGLPDVTIICVLCGRSGPGLQIASHYSEIPHTSQTAFLYSQYSNSLNGPAKKRKYNKAREGHYKWILCNVDLNFYKTFKQKSCESAICCIREWHSLCHNIGLWWRQVIGIILDMMTQVEGDIW